MEVQRSKDKGVIMSKIPKTYLAEAASMEEAGIDPHHPRVCVSEIERKMDSKYRHYVSLFDYKRLYNAHQKLLGEVKGEALRRLASIETTEVEFEE